MANLRLTSEFRGKSRNCPEGFVINIDDELLDDIMSGKLKAKLSPQKEKAVVLAPKDKMIKGTEKEIEKKADKDQLSQEAKRHEAEPPL